MALEMKKACGICGLPLDFESQAYICSYECTFCPGCATKMEFLCPNCEGELKLRPRSKIREEN